MKSVNILWNEISQLLALFELLGAYLNTFRRRWTVDVYWNFFFKRKDDDP